MDTQPHATRETDDNEGLLPDFYVEKDTQLIYECKFFDDFVLVRPATPRLYLAIKKVNHREFIEKFEECSCDKDQLRDFMRGAEPEFILN